jgi:hypothetical protein
MPTASQQLQDAVCALEPYRGGNGEHLWLINRLDVIDKHRLLVTIGTTYSSFVIDGVDMLRRMSPWVKDLPSMLVGVRPAVRYPLQAGTPLVTATPEFFEQYPSLKATFDVAFGEPEILEGEPVVPTLRGLLDEVKGLLERLIPLV